MRVEDFRYRQVAASIRAAIERGELRSGDAVPSAKQISQGALLPEGMEAVSIETARKALRVLVSEGIIYRESAGLPFYVK
jgi:DNA-binding GntR family transcriptional regulator